LYNPTGEDDGLARAAQARELVASGQRIAEAKAEVLHLDVAILALVVLVRVADAADADEVGDVVEEASGDAAVAVLGFVHGEAGFEVAEEGAGGLVDRAGVALAVLALRRRAARCDKLFKGVEGGVQRDRLETIVGSRKAGGLLLVLVISF